MSDIEVTEAGTTAVTPGSAEGKASDSPIDQVRRFTSRWSCDREFREALFVDARAAAEARGLSADPEHLRIFWDEHFRAEIERLPHPDAVRKIGPLGLVWLELERRNREYRDKVREESTPSDPRFAAWRKRQIARCNLSFRRALATSIPHAPFAIEPSKGCSIGCWFCGVSAPSLDGHFLCQGENAEFFRQLMETLARVVGRTAGKWGILYWATDPLDHPDYETLCSIFAKSFGQFPVTTTAQGWKDMPRLRRLIGLAGRGPARVRLSILNLKMMNLYLAELAPEEFASVSFVPINRDSVFRPADAGRARANRSRAWGAADASNTDDASISCVSGFLFNLVDKTVRLISPCPATDRWPDGSFLYEEKQYTNADDLRAIVEGMIDRHMPLGVPTEFPLRFNSDLIYSRTLNGFRLSSDMNSQDFEGSSVLGEIGDLINLGKLTMSEIAVEIENRSGVMGLTSLGLVEGIFSAGVLAMEPA